MKFLQDEAITVDGVHFFGGTMWTDFAGANRRAMITASQQMNDYRLIMLPNGQPLNPLDTIDFHKIFVRNLLTWFDQELVGPRVVISHNAPVLNLNTQYTDSPLMPAFNSLDMPEIIEKYQPDLWVYGHTHECDDQTIGKTRIISNQLGYPDKVGGYEYAGFDGEGKLIEL